jgi:renal tumor antigen
MSARQALRHPYFRELREQDKRQQALLQAASDAAGSTPPGDVRATPATGLGGRGGAFGGPSGLEGSEQSGAARQRRASGGSGDGAPPQRKSAGKAGGSGTPPTLSRCGAACSLCARVRCFDTLCIRADVSPALRLRRRTNSGQHVGEGAAAQKAAPRVKAPPPAMPTLQPQGTFKGATKLQVGGGGGAPAARAPAAAAALSPTARQAAGVAGMGVGGVGVGVQGVGAPPPQLKPERSRTKVAAAAPAPVNVNVNAAVTAALLRHTKSYVSPYSQKGIQLAAERAAALAAASAQQ